jgi:hypothetical protein
MVDLPVASAPANTPVVSILSTTPSAASIESGSDHKRSATNISAEGTDERLLKRAASEITSGSTSSDNREGEHKRTGVGEIADNNLSNIPFLPDRDEMVMISTSWLCSMATTFK